MGFMQRKKNLLTEVDAGPFDLDQDLIWLWRWIADLFKFNDFGTASLGDLDCMVGLWQLRHVAVGGGPIVHQRIVVGLYAVFIVEL